MNSRYTYSTIAVLVLGGIGLLVVVGGLLFPGTWSSSSEAERKVFLRYKAQAEQGDATAQFELGCCYADGRGVAKNVVEAYAWFELTGYPFVENGVPVQISANLAKSMSPQQLAKAMAGFAKPSANVAKKMSPEQIAAAKKRTEELRAQIAAKLKSSGK